MSSSAFSFRWVAGWVVMSWASLAAAEAVRPRWHCDVPALSPDGVHVAYLQWDSQFARIVVVSIDQPDKFSFFNFGDRGPGPFRLSWTDSHKIELRQGAATIASVALELPAGSPTPGPTAAPPPAATVPVASETWVLEKLQRQLPHRSIQVLGRDDAGRRTLLFADSVGVGGRYFVYDRSEDLLYEIATRKTPAPPP